MPDALIDIRPDHLRVVCGILLKHVPQYEVWAFGSRAKWTAKDYSDLDLCIVTDRPLSFKVLGALDEDFAESDLPWKVDVVDWATTSESFRKIIERDKVVVQSLASSAKGMEKIGGGLPMRSLGEVMESFDSLRRPVKASERQSGSYPYYGAQGIVDYVDGFLFDGEFVLVAEDGENLKSRKENIALMARGKFWVNNHAHILRGNKEADTRFLFYAINSTDISGYVTGSTIPKLSQGSLNRLLIPCPRIEEQRAIASLLGALDDKIELNRQMNETMEAMTRLFFKDWFVDFGPTR